MNLTLPDFLEELNQGAEKAFGEYAQILIDSLLYAKFPPKTQTLSQYGPPKFKRSVNMARLEKVTYDGIVAHLEEAENLEDDNSEGKILQNMKFVVKRPSG